MIIPAVVYKILGFKKKIGDKEFVLTPTEGYNVAFIQMDDGSVNEVSFYGNNKEFNSLKDYLEYKASQNIKKDKIQAYVADLSMTEDPTLLKIIEEETKKSEGLSKKEIFTKIATDILYDKVSIKSGSIVRSALAFTVDENGFSSKFNSRSIISAKDKEGVLKYSTTGIYSQATLANQIPIEIEPIKKNDGTFVGFFRLVTGSIISKQHVSSIIDHSIRTVQYAINENKNAFLPKILMQISNNGELSMLVNEINKLKMNLDKKAKDNHEISSEEYNRVIQMLSDFKIKLFEDKVNLPKFKMELPMIVSADDFKSKTVTYVHAHNVKRPEDLSPFRVFSDAIVSLNFSKEDPNVQKQAKEYVINTFLAQISNGNYAPRLLLNYNLPKGDILDNNDSWGYMINNVDFSKLVLSFRDSSYIISETEKYIDNMKAI